jgi:recombination protein U
LGLIQKIPTPITPVKIDKENRHITLAYFDQKSTVDYIGTVQGIPICFDAKECAALTFPLQNVHPHQIQFMEEFERQGGISFVVLSYVGIGETYYLPFHTLLAFWNRMKNGGRKSFRYEEIDKSFQIHSHREAFVHYLEALQKDLLQRD